MTLLLNHAWTSGLFPWDLLKGDSFTFSTKKNPYFMFVLWLFYSLCRHLKASSLFDDVFIQPRTASRFLTPAAVSQRCGRASAPRPTARRGRSSSGRGLGLTWGKQSRLGYLEMQPWWRAVCPILRSTEELWERLGLQTWTSARLQSWAASPSLEQHLPKELTNSRGFMMRPTRTPSWRCRSFDIASPRFLV